ncbi:MAG: hypothetical protein HYV90_02220 [Candidatus Woesebacteria bacterium]|nr:MAG: hypothetical protein HYV90_02220 [Candidatus Woesebacteria bacterium]
MNYYFVLTLSLLGYMTVWFIISVIKKRNDVADIAWGLWFVLMAWLSFLISGFLLKRFWSIFWYHLYPYSPRNR